MIIEIGIDNNSASYLDFEISDGKSVIAKCLLRACIFDIDSDHIMVHNS